MEKKIKFLLLISLMFVLLIGVKVYAENPFTIENKSLKTISLKNNKITNKSAIIIMNNLQKFENIRKLELEGNLIDLEMKQQINILLNDKLNKNKY